MSQIDEYRHIAVAYGRHTFDDHISNYFEKTGRIADDVAIKSMRARVNKELRVGGKLHDLRDTVVQPSENTSGRQSEWTIGLEPGADSRRPMQPVESEELKPLVALLNEPQRPEFGLASTNGNVQMAIQRTSKQSRIAQRELVSGMASQEYERRVMAMKAAAAEKADREKQARLDEQERVIAYFTGSSSSGRGNGRGMVVRRRDRDLLDRDDAAD